MKKLIPVLVLLAAALLSYAAVSATKSTSAAEKPKAGAKCDDCCDDDAKPADAKDAKAASAKPAEVKKTEASKPEKKT